MTEITQHHLEWATVERMRRMLMDVREGYRVTHTLALFTSITCWVMQRIRNEESGAADRAARRLWGELDQECVIQPPWDLNGEQLDGFEFTPESGLQTIDDLPASKMLVAIRNAVAHGDGRTVRPINENALLVGHEFSLEESNSRGRLWRGRARLRRADMRRIGDTLARRFCEAMQVDHADEPDFVRDANRISEAEAS